MSFKMTRPIASVARPLTEIRKAERRQVALEVGGQTHRTGLDLSSRRNPSAPSGLHGSGCSGAKAPERQKFGQGQDDRRREKRSSRWAIMAVRWVGSTRPSEMGGLFV